MMQTWQQIWESLQLQLPTMLGALAILIGGWIGAFVLATIARGALRKTTLDNRMARWMTGGSEVNTERIAGRVVFWTAMLFVLAGFFQFVGMTVLTEPVTGFLVQLFEFAPRLGGAALLGLLAWVTASVARVLVSQTINKLKLQARLEENADIKDAPVPELGTSVGNAAYWIVFLLFLPAILGTLALDGLLEPVQVLVNELMSYVPNVVTAVVLLLVGWLAAKILQRITVSLAVSLGADKLSQRTGLQGAIGKQSISTLLGIVVYVLVFIPVLIGSLNALGLDAITGPASNMLDIFLSSVPALFAASLIIALAYVVGKLVSDLVTGLLGGIGFDNVLSKLGISSANVEADRVPSRLVGLISLVAVLLFATIEAFSVLGFDNLAGLLTDLTMFGGNVLVAMLVFGFGMFLANLAGQSIRDTGVHNHHLLSIGARGGILVLTGAMALRQLGVADEIITLTFGLSLGAVAVAFAIAFGIGGRDVAAAKLAEWKGSLEQS